MKRLFIAFAVASSLLFTSCIGSFTMTSKVYSWNQKVTGNKFINTCILWILTPDVYPATVVIDYVVLNVIEFWTGANPLAFGGPQDLEKVVVTKSGTSKVVMGNNEITITDLDGKNAGKLLSLRYDPQSNNFFCKSPGGTMVKVGSISGSVLTLYAPDGRVITKSLAGPAADLAAAQ